MEYKSTRYLYSFFYNQYMRIYIDLFFLFNTIMDFMIILGTSIILKRNSNLIRIIISSLIGGISSVLLFNNINKILIEVISIIIMVLISFEYKGVKYVLRNIFYMYLLSTLIGGIIYLFNVKVSNNIFINYFIIIVISSLVLILYIKESRKIKNIYNNYYKVDIYFKDKSKISVVGFVDTGNNLYDPYKKRPIILLSNKYIREDNYILVPYYTMSGEGLLKCIKPDIIFIDGIGYKENVLIGFSDSPKLIDGVDVILHKDIMKGLRECLNYLEEYLVNLIICFL